jgi:hypothetical protein
MHRFNMDINIKNNNLIVIMSMPLCVLTCSQHACQSESPDDICMICYMALSLFVIEKCSRTQLIDMYCSIIIQINDPSIYYNIYKYTNQDY